MDKQSAELLSQTNWAMVGWRVIIRRYCSFAYSALASFKIGISGSAFMIVNNIPLTVQEYRQRRTIQ